MSKRTIILGLMLILSLPCFAFAQNKCLDLDGSGSFARIERHVQDDFTLQAWIKTIDSRGGKQFYSGKPIFHADVGGFKNDFGVSIINSKLAFGNGRPGVGDFTVLSNTPVATGEWVHITASREKSTGTIRIYVNGVLEGHKDTGNTGSLSDPKYIDIGGLTGAKLWLKGQVDEVRIWNRLFSDSEVAASMSKPLTGTEMGLVGYYTFEELTPQGRVRDLSVIGNHALLEGNAKIAQINYPPWFTLTPPNTITIHDTVHDTIKVTESGEVEKEAPASSILYLIIIIILVFVVLILISMLVVRSKK